MNARRYRHLIIGSLSLLIGLVVAVWAIYPKGDPSAPPDPVESVFPLPGDIVVRQTAVEVDLPIDYSLEVLVDGVTILEAEIGFTAATGRYISQPGPTRLLETWSSGEHTTTIRWNRISGGGPDPGEFTWKFRVT